MRVLIIKASALEEIIQALPVLDYLHQVKFGVEVDWVVEDGYRQVLEGNPLVSRLHLIRTEAWRKHPFAARTRREVAELRQALRERNYDLVFDIQGNLKSGLICAASGCPDRIGFSRTELEEGVNAFFTTRQIPLRRQDYHQTDKYLRLVSVPFARDFRSMRLAAGIPTTREEEANAEALLATLSDGLVFLFQHDATWPTRSWSLQSWIDLGKEVLDLFPDASILLPLGSKDAERDAATEIAAGIGRGARLLESMTLKELAALLKKVDLVVGGDTGVLQLAAAVGTPTVSFYRASDAKRSGPRGDGHVVIQSPMHCTRCFRTLCDKDAHCRDSIKVEAILGAINRLLGNTPLP